MSEINLFLAKIFSDLKIETHQMEEQKRKIYQIQRSFQRNEEIRQSSLKMKQDKADEITNEILDKIIKHDDLNVIILNRFKIPFKMIAKKKPNCGGTIQNKKK